MAFLERVHAAGNDVALACDANVAALELLKSRVQSALSAESLARMMAENPERARNELRSACRREFAAAEWESCSPELRYQLTENLVDIVFGLGPIEGLLADSEVTEIMVNGANSIFYEKSGVLRRSEAVFVDDDQVRALIDRIIGPLGRRIDESSPMVSARLPQGHRVHAIVPPIAVDGPLLTIRTFTAHVMTLDDMEKAGSLDAATRQFLVWAVRARKNIAVSGGTGSGKTTLLNALSCHIPFSERIITIEDSAELRFLDHPHVVRLEARARNAEGTGEVSIRELVANSLRMRPDRIVVGECRGGEALDMLQAMNTGHSGSLTTLHANAPREAVARLATMVRYAADLPIDVIEAHIASALDLIVQTERATDGRRYVSHVATVSFNWDSRHCEVRTLFRRAPHERRGMWVAEPEWLDDLPVLGIASDEEVKAWRGRWCSAA